MLLTFNFFSNIGKSVLWMFQHTGQIVSFAAIVLINSVTRKFYFKEWLKRIWEAGLFSLPVVGMTTLFSGMVLALISSDRIGADLASFSIPNLVVVAITRELAPVLTGLMVAGRIGAAYAAEISTMKVGEQTDALLTLSISPIKFLIVPRVIAVCLIMPFLVIIGDSIGIFGGWLVSVLWIDIPSKVFLMNGYEALDKIGVLSGLVKAVVFGYIIAIMGCYFGYNCNEGAQGVGESTTKAVVSSASLILISNYFITLIFFNQ